MSSESNFELVRSAYEALDARDFDGAFERYSGDLELRIVATGEVFRGPEGYQQHARAWFTALPDARLHIVRITGGESSATVEYVVHGTHAGALISSHGHIPATWMQIELPFCDTIELRDGKISRVSSYFDSGTLLRQIGLLPNSPLHPTDRRAPLELYAVETDTPIQQRNKAVVQWFLQSVVNRHDAAAATEFCVPNLVWHGGPLGELRDLPSFQQLLTALFSAIPDLKVEVDDAISEGDRVATRVSVRGTHQGEFQGAPPTGRVLSGTGATTYRVVDGKIAEEWWHLDIFGFMQQLDVVPALERFDPA